MTSPLSRRAFHQSALAATGSLWLASGSVFAEQQAGTERLLLLGLNALARAPQFNAFADGHRGASMIAAHLMCIDNDLPGEARARIVELFDRNWANGMLCRPFPDEPPVADAIPRIAAVLAERGEVLQQVGHNVIFAALAIKAFRLLPTAATPARVDGVCMLVGSFTPWRDEPPDRNIAPPPFVDSREASRFVLREASDAVDRYAGYGQGFAGHMLTFGQALIELAAMGGEDVAEACRVAYCKYITTTRNGPEKSARRIRDHQQTPLRPTDVAYWNQRGDKTLGLGHVFKYPYSYYDLLARADDPALAREWNAKAWHVF